MEDVSGDDYEVDLICDDVVECFFEDLEINFLEFVISPRANVDVSEVRELRDYPTKPIRLFGLFSIKGLM